MGINNLTKDAVIINHQFSMHDLIELFDVNPDKKQKIPVLGLILGRSRLIINKNKHVFSNSRVRSSHKILILLTTASHIDRKERSDKVLISYKIPHIRSGWHDKTLDCRVSKDLLMGH